MDSLRTHVFLVVLAVMEVESGLDPWNKPYTNWEILDPDQMPVAETTLKNVFVISRNGLYYPKSNKLKDDRFQTFPSKEVPDLTERGQMMMFRLGKMLLRRYYGFIKAVDKGVKSSQDPQRQYFKITATDSEVARSSAKEILKGMYMDADHKVETGGCHDFDKTYIIYEGETVSECKKFIQIRKKPWNPDELLSSTLDPDWKLVRDTLEVSKLQEVYDMYERMEMERLSDLALPSWATGPKGDKVVQAMRRLSIQRVKKITGNSNESWKFLVSTLLTSILEEFGYVKYSEDGSHKPLPTQKRHLHIHVADSALLYSLLSWLQLEDSAACSAYVDPYTVGPITCEDIGKPSATKQSNALREGKVPLYLEQVGDTLILEFHEDSKGNKVMKPYFLRMREENNSFKGFWWLTMERKLKQLTKSNRPGTAFDPILLNNGLIPPAKWKETCSHN